MVKIPLFRDVVGTELGEIFIDKDNVSVKTDSLKLSVPISYLGSLEIIERAQLGKLKVSIEIYDIIGNKNVVEAFMSEPGFHTLRGLKR